MAAAGVCCVLLSGLDARAAAIVMRAVRNTVNTGRTVVCTIHQPSISIFDVSIRVSTAAPGSEDVKICLWHRKLAGRVAHDVGAHVMLSTAL